ncbi:hypothetical protein N806_06550 [Rhodococcus sp. P27]|nr:hypothetical protein N806_06550 [Rhodococcus sp. P27]
MRVDRRNTRGGGEFNSVKLNGVGDLDGKRIRDDGNEFSPAAIGHPSKRIRAGDDACSPGFRSLCRRRLPGRHGRNRHLGTDVNGGSWIPRSASEEQIGNCPDLLWVSVDGDGVGDATYQSHVLFFHDGTYLGTATSKPYSYTHVIDSNKNSVSVQYRWLLDDDAFCCPQGGPNIVNFTWNGSAVVADGQFPPS